MLDADGTVTVVSRPNRIVFVLSKYAVGGAEKQLANLIAARPERARPWDVVTITLTKPRSDDVRRRFEAAGARNVLVDREATSFPVFLWRLIRELRRLRPRIVSTLLDSSVGAWGRLAALLAGVPVIVHSDRGLIPEGTRAHRLLRPLLDRATDRFLPNADAIADRLARNGVPRSKIRVMHNGVDLHVFDPERATCLRDSWGIDADATVLGFLGRIAPVKRVDVLLDAVRRLREDERPDQLVLAGDGASLPEIRATVEGDPWLREHARLIGTIDDAPAFLASIDYLVLSSEAEGFPNVVLEAMAMGKPVVATAVSDVPFLLGDTGILAAPSDVDSLARALATVQTMTPAERAILGRRARERAKREFDIAVCAERFWGAHLELAADVPGASGTP